MAGVDVEALNRGAVERALEYWNRGNLPDYLGLYSEDVVLHGYSGLEPGFASVRRFYESWWQSFPGSQLVLQDLITADDKVACRFVIEATHAGPFQGVPASGKPVSVSGFTILRFVDAKCVERWSLVDSLGLLTQIGALGWHGSPPDQRLQPAARSGAIMSRRG
jgi:steroid delta-isomerase-like uncharacterized protein